MTADVVEHVGLPVQSGNGEASVEQRGLLGLVLKILGEGHRVPEVAKLLVEFRLSRHIELGIPLGLVEFGSYLDHRHLPFVRSGVPAWGCRRIR